MNQAASTILNHVRTAGARRADTARPISRTGSKDWFCGLPSNGAPIPAYGFQRGGVRDVHSRRSVMSQGMNMS